jgi:predicted nucleotidyltransferase
MPDAAAKLVLTAALAAILIRALVGAPPDEPKRGTAAALAVAGCCIYVVALAVALGGHAAVGTLLVAPGVAILALAGWLARGDDEGPGGGREVAPDPPVDWDEFDRLRAEWSRTGPRVLIPL